ncbi:hypothetical protein HPP92_009256 [Vanilla planifolia]|uniref:Uncharacterized protein n=1 Tax=Vanilla planifolia TaxID=51239 RepID=A0A835RFC4_VANPL|nr:hypothetical protein HPP92_009256 [Vanilla planifolia]
MAAPVLGDCWLVIDAYTSPSNRNPILARPGNVAWSGWYIWAKERKLLLEGAIDEAKDMLVTAILSQTGLTYK